MKVRYLSKKAHTVEATKTMVLYAMRMLRNKMIVIRADDIKKFAGGWSKQFIKLDLTLIEIVLSKFLQSNSKAEHYHFIVLVKATKVSLELNMGCDRPVRNVPVRYIQMRYSPA